MFSFRNEKYMKHTHTHDSFPKLQGHLQVAKPFNLIWFVTTFQHLATFLKSRNNICHVQQHKQTEVCGCGIVLMTRHLPFSRRLWEEVMEKRPSDGRLWLSEQLLIQVPRLPDGKRKHMCVLPRSRRSYLDGPTIKEDFGGKKFAEGSEESRRVQEQVWRSCRGEGIKHTRSRGFEQKKVCTTRGSSPAIGTLFAGNRNLLRHHRAIHSYSSASISSLIYYPPRWETARWGARVTEGVFITSVSLP